MSKTELKPENHSHLTQNLQSTSAPLAASDANLLPRDWKFWCIILSLAIPLMLTTIEFSAVETALPKIVSNLGGSQFVWVGSAYTLGSSAFLPFCGGLAQIFGRRIAMLSALFLFALGSALCGAAPSLNFLIAGRAVQGLGSGAIADLVPLRDRGAFNGIMALAFALGGGTAPVIGGSLAQRGNHWRWLFYLNLPICGLAAILVAAFMRLKTPKAPLSVQFARMDWIGNFLIVSSTTAVVIALTFGGLQFAWKSTNVLVPLVLGLLGLCAFLVYEIMVAAHPIIPVRLIVTDRTTLSGYTQNFLNATILATITYWLPVYFQACKDASPIASGVDVFGLSYTISPFAVVTGAVVQKLGKYWPPIWFGWALTIISVTLFTTLDEGTSRGKAFWYEILAGCGIGIVHVSAYFPVLSPIPVNKNAPALVFYTFLRNFSLVWGVTIGGAILQNELTNRLPQAPSASLPNARGSQLAFAAIPLIKGLNEPLKTQVRAAFADAMQVVWEVLAGIAGIAGAGFLVSLAMKHFPLHTYVDSEWGRADGAHDADKPKSVQLGLSRGEESA